MFYLCAEADPEGLEWEGRVEYIAVCNMPSCLLEIGSANDCLFALFQLSGRLMK